MIAMARGTLAGWLCCFGINSAQAQAGLEHVFEAPEGTQLKGVTVAADESVYAVLSGGGPDNQGALIRYMPDGQVFVLHAFAAAERGIKPNTAPAFGRDGAVYGTTSQGGKNGFGTLYRLDDCNELQVLHDFSSDDAGPVVGPLFPAAEGGFYAVTYGLYDENPNREQLGEWAWITRANGKIIYISETGAVRTLLQGVTQPNGGVVVGADGYLHGTQPRIVAWRGDPIAFGNVYRLKPDGSNFGTSLNYRAIDFNPGGQVTIGPDGSIYGVSAGGPGEGPRSFRIALDSATNLAGIYGEIAWEGSTTAGIALGDDGNAYGASSAFFRATPSGVVTHIHEIDGATPPPTAAIQPHPDGGFVVPSGDHLLRLSQAGGVSVLHRFGYQDGAALRDLWQGRDGLVYGTTDSGGQNGAGTLFRFESDGTLHTLVSWPGWVESPGRIFRRSELSEGSDGTLYGVSQRSSEYVIFSVTTSGALETLRVFSNADAPYLYFSVGLEVANGTDGALYGTLDSWEPGPSGAFVRDNQVFRFEPESPKLSVLARSDVGRFYYLLAARDGALYAVFQTESDRRYELVRITSEGTLTLHAFRSDDQGHTPASNLVEAADGGIFGYASANSTSAKNIIYRWSADRGLTTEHSLSANAPATPKLVLAPDGALFGTQATPDWPQKPGAFIITTTGQIIEQSDPGLGTLVTHDSNAYRIQPLTRGSYSGFRLTAMEVPN